MKILIIGAGIGGLVSARLLAREGHDVVVAESAAEPRAAGAGIVLPTNTVASLEESGVDLDGLGLRLPVMAITTPDGRARLRASHRVSFARPELMVALTRGLEPLVDLRYGAPARLTSTSGARHPSAEVGSSVEQFDFIVGADGLRSRTRVALYGTETSLRYSGQVCWRAIVPGHHVDGRTTEMWDGTERIGVVPLTRDRTYVYIVTATAAGTHPSTPPLESKLAAKETWATEQMLRLAPDSILCHELWEVDRPAWGTGQVALLGDAAHAVTPNLGLGAAMAIQDAVALTNALRSPDNTVSTYRLRRQPTVRSTQLQSRMLGRIAHSPSLLARGVRHALGLHM